MLGAELAGTAPQLMNASKAKLPKPVLHVSLEQQRGLLDNGDLLDSVGTGKAAHTFVTKAQTETLEGPLPRQSTEARRESNGTERGRRVCLSYPPTKALASQWILTWPDLPFLEVGERVDGRRGGVEGREEQNGEMSEGSNGF